MRRSTTSAATDRTRLGLLLLAELILAATLVGRQQAAPHPSTPVTAPAALSTPAATTLTLPDGRNVHLVSLLCSSRAHCLLCSSRAHCLLCSSRAQCLGDQRTTPLLTRIAGQIGEAAEAVTAFWGADWPRDIVIAAAGSDEQFGALAGGGSDIAAATTGQHIVFAPGATAMSADALRIVLRHELFHYAARSVTAVDAPRWLTEGVADFVARPPTPPTAGASALGAPPARAELPTDADLATAGPARSAAYDRAWLFTRYVADRYGTAALRALYVRACGAGHPDVATAVRDTLGDDMDVVLTRWAQWLAR
jgi:hypothetical protein